MRDDLVWPSRLGVRLARPDSPTGKVTSVHLLLPDCLLAPAASAASRYLWHLAVCWLYRNCSQKPTTRLTQPPDGQQARSRLLDFSVLFFVWLFLLLACWRVANIFVYYETSSLVSFESENITSYFYRPSHRLVEPTVNHVGRLL